MRQRLNERNYSGLIAHTFIPQLFSVKFDDQVHQGFRGVSKKAQSFNHKLTY